VEKYELMGGKLHLYKRPNSRFWQCYTFLAGRPWRESTKEENPLRAKEIAEDWYLSLKGKNRAGELKAGKTFRFVAGQFLREYRILTEGERSPRWVAHLEGKLDRYLIPYFGSMVVSEITPGKVQEYRIHRAQNGYLGKPPARNTIEHEMIALRQVLKTAVRHRWLEHVPDFSPPFKSSRKVSHRAWFSKQEYRQLYLATRERAANPKKEIWRWECEQLHDLVLFLANTGLRPDEAKRLEYRDVNIVRDRDSNETILEIEVRGKAGVGFCKSTSSAVRPFTRLKRRNSPQPSDLLFPRLHRQLFNNVLDELGLKFDRDGRRRTLYSLRHTYICLRLMEGADIYQIAKNCRTSVEMIQKHYAAHIKNVLNAAKINTRRAKAPRQPKELAANAATDISIGEAPE
jgi:integrase